MESHNTGAITGTRLGSSSVTQSVPLDFAVNGANAVKAFTVDASTAKPVVVDFGYATETTVTGAGPTIQIGSTSAGSDLVSPVAPPLAGQAGWNTLPKLLTAPTDVYIKFGASVTGGKVHFMFTLQELNVQDPSKT